MTVVRRLLAASAVTSIVTTSLVLGSAAPAQAKAVLNAPAKVTSNSSVTITGTVDPLFDAILYVDGSEVAKGDQRVSYTWNPSERQNGSYTLKLVQKGKLVGARWDETSATLKQAIPPATPSGVDARLQGNDQIVVTWPKGDEPDLQSYEVATTQSGVVGKLPVGQACSSSSCKAVLAVPPKAAGQPVGFTVKAHRSDGEGGSIASGFSAPAVVMIPAPPAAKPKKTTQPTTAPKDKNKQGVEAFPTLPAKDKSKPATTTNAQTPKVKQKLPEIPETDEQGNFPLPSPEASGPKADGDAGTLTPESDGSTDGKEAPAVETGVKAQSSESPIGTIGQYGLYVAGGLILLLLAAHGGAWARRRALAAAGAAAAGPGAGPTRGSAAGVWTSGATPRPGGQVTGPVSAHSHLANDSLPPTSSAPRRSAVVLAVAKVRTAKQPEQPAVPDQLRQDASPVSLPLYLSADDLKAGQREAEAVRSGQRDAEVVRSGQRDAEAVRSGPREAEVARAGQREAEEVRSGQRDAAFTGAAHQLDADIPRPELGAGSGLGSGSVRQAGAHEARADAVRISVEREGGPVRADLGPRHEPVRLALPSSAVTVVPEGERGAARPAIKIEERWDDYLPPSPRSMEDSGFWERPQPGAGDFWAADEDELAERRRRRDEES
ncbi:hypothetical protein [Nonomuraea soli]|uniref:Fibronectin type-III domain-containing protein n=1 Tax=Nonomuraea soli TaxID=1032476 RepID=A0A7W0CHR8_9ACTN|nr:hypothetical protein [Nonomuraea soli]MBA2891363.1 hypothetical protein [Nonomuraea soli]